MEQKVATENLQHHTLSAAVSYLAQTLKLDLFSQQVFGFVIAEKAQL